MKRNQEPDAKRPFPVELFPAIGLVLGGGAGMALGVVLAGGPGIAWGLVIGAGVGLAIGAVIWISIRRPQR